jgi:hypothetical protein
VVLVELNDHSSLVTSMFIPFNSSNNRDLLDLVLEWMAICAHRVDQELEGAFTVAHS